MVTANSVHPGSCIEFCRQLLKNLATGRWYLRMLFCKGNLAAELISFDRLGYTSRCIYMYMYVHVYIYIYMNVRMYICVYMQVYCNWKVKELRH